jgi:hypothetical protein
MPGSADIAWSYVLPVVFDITTAGTSTAAVPYGATQVVVEVWGGGGGGGGMRTDADNYGGGGAAGGYTKVTKTLTAADRGKTISYTVNNATLPGANSGTVATAGQAGNSCSASCTGFSFGAFTLSSGGGTGGGAATGALDGIGGTPGGSTSGGDVGSVVGQVGDAGDSVALLPGFGGAPEAGTVGNTVYGGGGIGGYFDGSNFLEPLAGSIGRVYIKFT